MNVSEVERHLGMTRANIRFYEKEGLIQPARSENAYRDYSEEDVKALEKIKLLRQLHLDLDTIGRIQRGELPLSAAVGEQLERLRAERVDMEWAERICRDLTETKVDYAGLDARPYLERLNRPADEPGYFGLVRDSLGTVPHPWRRYLARMLDLSIYSLLWSMVQLLLLRWNPEPSLFINLLDSYIGLFTMLILEPIMLSTWGYTPGKFIMGLTVRDGEGQKLTISAAWERTVGMFKWGLGYGIPIYNLVRLWKSRAACLRDEALDWETGHYRMRDEKPWRAAALTGAYALWFFLLFVIVAQAAMPIHRGDLTAAEYTGNINDAVRYNRVFDYQRMDETGQWIEEVPTGTYVIDMFNDDMPNHRLTVTDGLVTGVRLEVETTNPEFAVYPSTAQKQLAAIALVAAQRSYNSLSWSMSGVLKEIEAGGMGDYTIQAGEMTITNRVEYSGMMPAGDMLFPTEGEQAYCHMVFTIEKNT